MEWYAGSIEAAIGAVREKGSLLVVLVRDDKPASTAMVENMNTASPAFTDCTCLQLTFGTDTCRQFNVYYPVLIVPSLYIIDGAGLCLEVLAGTVEPVKLQDVLTDIKQKMAEAPPQLVAPQPVPTQQAVPQQAVPQQAVPQQAVRQQAVPQQTASSDHNAALLDMINQSSTTQSPAPAPAPSAGVSPLSLDDKMKRANELLEKKRREEAAAELEKEKEKEKERRSVGVAIAEQKRQREQEERRRHGEEMRRNKITQKAEMEVIRAQIARDKAERRGESSGTVTAVPDTTVIDPNKVKVLIKFPANSTTVSHTFHCEDTLGDVVQYAVKQLGKDNFTLWNTHPRRQYKSADLSHTLNTLGLAGSASLLGMSGKGYSMGEGEGPANSANSATPPSTPSTAPASSSSQLREPSSKPIQCRLQFKMLDGSSVVNAFPVDTLLADAVQWFHNEKDTGPGTLWCSYPRYEITSDHLIKSLTELGMCPSAVIFVCSNTADNGQVTTNQSNYIWSVVFTVLRLPLTILEVLKSFMFPANSRRRPRPPPLEREEGPVSEIPPVSDNMSPDSEGVRKRSRLEGRGSRLEGRAEGRAEGTRLDGNIARLAQEGDDSEDNNVYNGNSTQLQ